MIWLLITVSGLDSRSYLKLNLKCITFVLKVNEFWFDVV